MNLLARTRFAGLTVGLQFARALSTSNIRYQKRADDQEEVIDVDEVLSKPTWSVSRLLPPKDEAQATSPLSAKQLHHLLRLSALPPPKDEREEAEMLSTLASQLHFVKEIQKIDTVGVKPFQSLRDETKAGEKEAELCLAAMKDALAHEEVRGRYHRRVKRVRKGKGRVEADWDLLGGAGRKIGRYFVVQGGKEG